MSPRPLPNNLQLELNQAQRILDALVHKARGEGYEIEIFTRAENAEMLYAISATKRFYAVPVQPALRPID